MRVLHSAPARTRASARACSCSPCSPQGSCRRGRGRERASPRRGHRWSEPRFVLKPRRRSLAHSPQRGVPSLRPLALQSTLRRRQLEARGVFYRGCDARAPRARLAPSRGAPPISARRTTAAFSAAARVRVRAAVRAAERLQKASAPTSVSTAGGAGAVCGSDRGSARARAAATQQPRRDCWTSTCLISQTRVLRTSAATSAATWARRRRPTCCALSRAARRGCLSAACCCSARARSPSTRSASCRHASDGAPR